ncbi:MAG TPA: DNA replication and repair protein RecF [Spirochaetota bacterium]|nr:DNA replication and repair protein RecF [Spirochaetota bacterium]HSA15217.1 DNA replication and repair protein RecF [Spirochaetota bacterium]
MYLKKLTLKNFRNYGDLSIEFSPEITFIVGNNGVGKSNIIEAISLTSTMRSFRNIPDIEMIQWGFESYYCSSEIEDSQDRLFEVGCSCQGGKLRKRIKIDGIEIRSISEFYGKFLTVVFAPFDINIINGMPELRRRFTDSVISKTNSHYLSDLSEFRKVLLSRNRFLKLLKEKKNLDMSELDVWDHMFASVSSRIIKARKKFFVELNDLFKNSYKGISDDLEAPDIHYASSIDSDEPDYIIRKLSEIRNKDSIIGSTGIGPQRDDFIIKNHRNINFVNYASQGQRRMAAICLKISECDFIESKTGTKAVIMVDDIFSELDSQRRKNMIKVLKRGNQIIFTMVHQNNADSSGFNASKTYHVSNGGILDELV